MLQIREEVGFDHRPGGMMANLWDEAVVRPLGRLSDECASELPNVVRAANVIPTVRSVSA